MPYAVRNPECIATLGLACFPFARRYLGNRCFFLFLRLLRCFSSAGYLPMTILFTIGWPDSTLAGFPHSEIHGSMDICSSPWLIAACHVLLRLLMPRHSSYALSSLTFSENRQVWGKPSFLLLVLFVTLVLNDLSFSLSFHYVSKSCKVFRYQYVFQHFSYPFLFEKTLIFSESFDSFLLTSSSLFSFQTSFSSILDAWKVNSAKRLLVRLSS